MLLLADLVALVGGTVHSMVPGEAPRLATVLVRGERIEAVAPGLELPPGAERHDVTGKHVVPGLIDGMVHFDADHDALYVAAGITAVRDVGSERVKTLVERFPEARDRTPGPTLYTGGAILDGDPPGSTGAVVLRDPAAADSLLPILFEDQIDFVSIHDGLLPAVWSRVIQLAHEREHAVWGPLPERVTLAQALEAGQDGLLYLDALLPPEVDWKVVQPAALEPAIEALAAGSTAVTPLIHPLASRFLDQREVTGVVRMLSPTYERWWLGELDTRLSRMSDAARTVGTRVVEKQRAALARLHEEGIELVPGSGAPHPWLFPGQAFHLELSEWERAGIPPADVLRAATRGAASAMGVQRARGSIVPGLVADLLVVGGDPREGVAVLREPELVVLRGRVLERADLDDLLASLGKRLEAERAALDAPIALEPPPTPEGALVLEARVENLALARRLSEERVRVVRRPDGRTTYSGRTGYPRTAQESRREMVVQQTTDPEGRLESFRVELQDGEHRLAAEGLWSDGSVRLRRFLDETPLDTKTFDQRPVCLDLASATSLLILAQRDLDRPFPVLTLHESLEPEAATWAMELDDKGDHQVRTHLGRLAFRLDASGMVELARMAIGSGIVETRLTEADAFGGPGLPLPASKRARIDALRAEAATREASSEPAGEAQGAEGAGEDGGAGGDPAEGGGEGDEGGGVSGDGGARRSDGG